VATPNYNAWQICLVGAIISVGMNQAHAAFATSLDAHGLESSNVHVTSLDAHDLESSHVHATFATSLATSKVCRLGCPDWRLQKYHKYHKSLDFCLRLLTI
jgi:hypothetical protein